VDLEAAGPETVFERLEELHTQTGRSFIHPFDDPFVIAGQGTVGLEIAEDVPDVDVVVVPVGGGGLIAGIATALPNARIVGVEPRSSNALSAALAAGEPVPVEPKSIADGLNAPFAGRLPLDIARARGLDTVLVDEQEIEAGMRFVYGRAKLACEPAGAAAVAALLVGKVALEEGETVVAVVSGGNVSGDIATAILGQL
jgi:threonine dehydratase